MRLDACLIVACAPLTLGVLAPSASGQPVDFQIDPTRTYLRVNLDPGAGDSVAIPLAGRGLCTGDRLLLERLGGFQYNDTANDGDYRGITGVFSTSDVLLPGDQLNRVPGAIDAGADYETWDTFEGSLPTDIDEDFLVGDHEGFFNSVTITVPSDARFLFLAALDDFYGDNTDPNGDFIVRMTIIKNRCGDCDGNGVFNTLDFLCYLNLFSSGDPAADCNGDGVVNTLDFLAFLSGFASGTCF